MAERKPPIYSIFEDNPDVTAAIDAFVVSLAERVDQLQDAEAEGDLGGLVRLAGELAESAAKLGYPVFVEVAQSVISACEGEKPDAVEDALVELTAVSHRIRMGHRGAA